MVWVVLRLGAVIAIVALTELLPARVGVHTGVTPIGTVAAVAAGVGDADVAAVASF